MSTSGAGWRDRLGPPPADQDPCPPHLRGTDRDPAVRAARRHPTMAQPVGGRDLALRLALIQAGVITTQQLAEAEAALGLSAASRVMREKEGASDG